MSKPISVDQAIQRIRNYIDQSQSDQLVLVGPQDTQVPIQFDSATVIFVDGGARHRVGHSGLSVGDGDSYVGNLDLVVSPQKNISDLAMVLRGVPESVSHLRMFGFLGGRFDHHMIVLGELHNLLMGRTKALSIEMENQVRAFSAGRWEFSHTGTFTVFAFTETEIEITGACQYPLGPSAILPSLSSLGLSNTAIGTVIFEAAKPIFVFLVQ